MVAWELRGYVCWEQEFDTVAFCGLGGQCHCDENTMYFTKVTPKITSFLESKREPEKASQVPFAISNFRTRATPAGFIVDSGSKLFSTGVSSAADLLQGTPPHD